MTKMSVIEYAERVNLSRQAVMKRIQAGTLDAVREEVEGIPKGRWMVLLPKEMPERVEPAAEGRLSEVDAYTPVPAWRAERMPKPEQMDEAGAFAVFCDLVLARLAESQERVETWREIAEEYNAREFAPALYGHRGRRSERTLRRWFQKWQEAGRDQNALLHKPAGPQGRKVTAFEQDYLMARLLTDKKVPIRTAIQDLKTQAEAGICESPSSESTLRRWVSDWQRGNPDLWAQARKGSKYVLENIVKSIMRDDSLIEVGDVLVADGHTLAFDVINPVTGKPARLTWILIYDWKSRYPLGGALALTESSQHVLVAVRNAILHLGYLPQWVYFDNGRAFKAKLFHKRPEDRDLEMEFAGIFPRLGIEAAFALPYNARSKVIERFFRTFQEGFERFQGSFRGSSIDDKPANLMRNEKWAQKMFAGKSLEYAEAMDLIYYYCRFEYGMRAHGGIGGKKPFEVFEARELPDWKKVDPSRLDYMMLKADRARLRSEGIWLDKVLYWAPALVKYIGQELIIRYDYSDRRWILVYDNQNRYICHAEMRTAQDGFVFLDKDNPLAWQTLQAEMRENRNLHKKIKRNTERLVAKTQKRVEQVLAGRRHLVEQRMEGIKEENPQFRNPPMVQAPEVEPDPRELVAALAANAREKERGSVVVDATPDKEEISTLAERLRARGIS